MKTREIRQIDVDNIYIGERRRVLQDDTVKSLAASMKEIGLLNPISVRMVNGEFVLTDGEVVEGNTACLIAGAHRLAAAKLNGWEQIECLIVDADDIDAGIFEIDENLARAELTTDEKRTQLRLRKELWEKREAGTKSFRTSLADGRSAGPQHQKGFVAETAERTGLSPRRVQQLLADPKPRPIATGVGKAPGVDASESRLKTAQRAYNALNDEERSIFLEWLNEAA